MILKKGSTYITMAAIARKPARRILQNKSNHLLQGFIHIPLIHYHGQAALPHTRFSENSPHQKLKYRKLLTPESDSTHHRKSPAVTSAFQALGRNLTATSSAFGAKNTTAIVTAVMIPPKYI